MTLNRQPFKDYPNLRAKTTHRICGMQPLSIPRLHENDAILFFRVSFVLKRGWTNKNCSAHLWNLCGPWNIDFKT
jgi:hypothetical protein